MTSNGALQPVQAVTINQSKMPAYSCLILIVSLQIVLQANHPGLARCCLITDSVEKACAHERLFSLLSFSWLKMNVYGY